MRPPNLVTAAADVLAGFAAGGLANPRLLPWLLVSTTCLYGGGVVLNDTFDAELDAQERPERPIPSGKVSVRAAAIQGAVLLALGVGAAAVAYPLSGAVASLIAGCALLYDAWGKHRAAFGALNMGACRGLNLLLGLSTGPALAAQRWPLALIPLAYVAAITAVSRGEVRGAQRRPAALALGILSLVMAALAALALTPGVSFLALLPFLLVFTWLVLPKFGRAYLRLESESARAAVKAGVLGLIVLDATIAAGYAGPLYGIGILALLALAAGLARLFAVT